MRWVFVSVRGLSLVVASGGHSSSRCVGLSLSRPLLLRSTGSRRAGSVIVAHGLSCSAACGIFPDQGSNLRAPHWQADSQPLRHQGSPLTFYTLSCSGRTWKSLCFCCNEYISIVSPGKIIQAVVLLPPIISSEWFPYTVPQIGSPSDQAIILPLENHNQNQCSCHSFPNSIDSGILTLCPLVSQE